MRLAGVCMALLLLAGCVEAQEAPQNLPCVEVQVGDKRVRVQVADDDAERAKGLMFVTEMAEDEGMLFVWPDKAVRSFWMRNTLIPLDLMFIEDERIVRIVTGVPLDESGLVSGMPVDKVLEVNGGWAARHGVGVGDLVIGH